MDKIEAQNVKLKIRNRRLKYELDKLKEIEEEHRKINGKLREENKQLKDNWNKLKNIAKSQSDFKLKCHNESLWFEVDELLNKMQELENGGNNG